MNPVAESVKDGGAKVAPPTITQNEIPKTNIAGGVPYPTLNGPPQQQTPVGVTVPPPLPKVETPVVQSPPTQAYYPPLDKEVRIGSRKVKIEIIPKFNMLPKDPKAKQIRDEVTKKIGSQWKRNSRDIIRGLSHEEELIYLPNIIAISSTHDDWTTRVYEYWANFNFIVPPEDGVTLEAGFALKKDRTGNYIATPIDVTDYIKYNFARQNSNVANEGEDNPATYIFRLIDTSEVAIREELRFSAKLSADRLYMKLIDESRTIQSEKAKIDHILETYGGQHSVGMAVYNLTDIQKQVELAKIKDKDYAAFEEILKDKNLENKALINKAITFKKIERVGTAYFYNGIAMGRSILEACLWLDDSANSHHKLILIEALEAYRK